MSKQKNSRDRNQAAAPQELSLAEMGKKLHDANKVVKQQVEELNLVKERSVKRLEEELNPVIQRSVVKQQVEELNSVIERSVKRLEEELNPIIQSLGEMEEVYKVNLKKPGFAEIEKFYKQKIQEESLAEMEKKLQEAKPVVKRLEKELNLVKERLSEMEEVYKVSLRQAGLAEMEKFYKRKIQEERSAHEKTKEEYKSFKERVAGDVDLVLKMGNSEDMNSPVNETRLKEMYIVLRKYWAKIKSKFKQAPQSDPEIMKAWIQHSFQHGADEIEQKKKLIDSAFSLHADDTPASEKVHKYTKLIIQNLQLVVYHRFKDPAVQEGEPCDDSWNNLLSNCHWLSCLLVLNDPTLQPDWKNHDPGQDAWNIFPQEIIADSAMSLCQDHSEHVRKCPWTFQHPDVNQTEDIEMSSEAT